jgi:CheY-like chemotaxis protein
VRLRTLGTRSLKLTAADRSSRDLGAGFANAQTRAVGCTSLPASAGELVNTDCNAYDRRPALGHAWPVHTNTLCLDHAAVRILIVNDDMRSADNLKHTLADLGYSETLVAYSAKRAMAAVAGYSPSIALVDLEIADMTGYRLAGLLKVHALWQVRNIPLIAVAEQAASATAELAHAAGFIGVLTKPIRLSTLRGLLIRRLP